MIERLKSIKVKITWRQVATGVLAVSLLVLNFSMRNVIWKQMKIYDTQNTQHEKLALAYHLGGQRGFEYELGMLLRYSPDSSTFLNNTAEAIKGQKEPEGFLRSSMAADREKIKGLRRNRFILSGIIYVILALQLFCNALTWYESHKHVFHKPPPM